MTNAACLFFSLIRSEQDNTISLGFDPLIQLIAAKSQDCIYRNYKYQQNSNIIVYLYGGIHNSDYES